jgi:hypothetical protein
VTTLRGWLDLFLYYTSCLWVFHRWTRQDLGYGMHDHERMVCTRCGTLGEHV